MLPRGWSRITGAFIVPQGSITSAPGGWAGCATALPGALPSKQQQVHKAGQYLWVELKDHIFCMKPKQWRGDQTTLKIMLAPVSKVSKALTCGWTQLELKSSSHPAAESFVRPQDSSLSHGDAMSECIRKVKNTSSFNVSFFKSSKEPTVIEYSCCLYTAHRKSSF